MTILNIKIEAKENKELKGYEIHTEIKKQGSREIMIKAFTEAIQRDKELEEILMNAFLNINFNNK